MTPGMDAAPAMVAIVLVTVATLALGAYGLRLSRTTSDFMVASRAVGPLMNASAISGEYLSAASFLGVAPPFTERSAMDMDSPQRSEHVADQLTVVTPRFTGENHHPRSKS